MPEFTLASLRIVCFSLYYHLVVFICNSPNRKEAGKKTRTGKNSACVFSAACTVPFPITFTATHRVPSSPHVPVLQPVPTDVPGVPEHSQRSQFTARMHSNAGKQESRFKQSISKRIRHATRPAPPLAQTPATPSRPSSRVAMQPQQKRCSRARNRQALLPASNSPRQLDVVRRWER